MSDQKEGASGRLAPSARGVAGQIADMGGAGMGDPRRSLGAPARRLIDPLAARQQRIECLKLAVALHSSPDSAEREGVLSTAKQFAEFVEEVGGVG